jgi:hypothetical protein
VKNDAKDAESIAKLAKFQEVKYSLVPEPQILALRMMAREYYALSDMLTEMKNRLCTDIYLIFPGRIDIFALLRDEKPFVLRSPEDHQTWRKDKNSHLSIVA